jgi:hypothetical protein
VTDWSDLWIGGKCCSRVYLLRYPSGSFCVSTVYAAENLSGVGLSLIDLDGSMRSSCMRLQMFGMNLLQRAEWQGYTAFLWRQNKTVAIPE